MKNKILTLSLCLFFFSCNELQQVVNQLPQGGVIGNDQIASGLREALNFGIEKQVTKLTQTDGFFKDEGLKVLNRAAEDAVKEATPIFVNAVKGITFNDAKQILLGSEDAATNYLKSTTETQLYASFNPVIKNSFEKVGADQVWNNLITKYNDIPFVTKVNPDLTDYVTQQALKGVYTMISVEEKEIRTKTASRTTALLQKVFALQDK